LKVYDTKNIVTHSCTQLQNMKSQKLAEFKNTIQRAANDHDVGVVRSIQAKANTFV